MKILVFGGSGRLGKRVVEVLAPDHLIHAPTHHEVPVESSYLTAFIDSVRPNMVINCTAMNGLERCDQNPGEAIDINSIAPGIMAVATRDIKASFIHFSTDYANPPVSVYGATKLAGEGSALINPRALVIRVMSIYDFTDFAGSLGPIQQWEDGRGRSVESPIKVFKQRTSPTYTGWIAEVVKACVNKYHTRTKFGVVELSPSDSMWKLYFGIEALKLFLGDRDFHIETGNDLKIARPLVSLFNTAGVHDFLDELNIPYTTVKENLLMAYDAWQTHTHAGSGTRASRSA
jgi:dTDP-4-dehydrorhamnose reductase